MKWLLANWEMVCSVAGLVLTGLLNSATKHYTLSDGWKRVIWCVVDWASPLLSKGSAGLHGPLPGLGRLKLPGLQVSPAPPKVGLVELPKTEKKLEG
jgi:hypothetical protein